MKKLLPLLLLLIFFFPSLVQGEEKGTGKKDSLLNQSISLQFKDSSLSMVLHHLSREMGINLISSHPLQGRLTLDLQNVPASAAMDILEEKANLQITRKFSQVWIVRQFTPVDLNYNNASLERVLFDLAKKSGINLALSPSIRGSVTLELNQVNPLYALESIVKTAGFRLLKERENLYMVILKKEKVEKDYQRLFSQKGHRRFRLGSKKEKISLQVKDLALEKVIKKLAQKLEVNAIVDPSLTNKMTFSLNQVSPQTAQKVISHLGHCKLQVLAPRVLKASPKKGISLSLSRRTLEEAVEIMIGKENFPLLYSTSLSKKVSFYFDQISWSQALRALSVCTSTPLRRLAGGIYGLGGFDSQKSPSKSQKQGKFQLPYDRYKIYLKSGGSFEGKVFYIQNNTLWMKLSSGNVIFQLKDIKKIVNSRGQMVWSPKKKTVKSSKKRQPAVRVLLTNGRFLEGKLLKKGGPFIDMAVSNSHIRLPKESIIKVFDEKGKILWPKKDQKSKKSPPGTLTLTSPEKGLFNLKAQGASLGKIYRELARLLKINILVDADVDDISVTIDLKKVTWRSLVFVLLTEYRCQSEILSSNVLSIEPLPSIHFSLKDKNLPTALNILASLGGLDLVYSDLPRGRFSLHLSKVSAPLALRALGKYTGSEIFRQGRVYGIFSSSINSSSKEKKRKDRGPRISSKTPEMAVTVEVREKPIREFFGQLAKRKKINILVAENVKGKISLSLQNTSLPIVLQIAGRKKGLKVESLAENFYRISKAKTTSMEFTRAEISAVINLLERQTKKNVIISSQVSGRVSLNFRDVPFEDALRAIVKARGYQVQLHRGGIYSVVKGP